MHLFIKNSITHTPILYQNTGNNLVFYPTTAILMTPSSLVCICQHIKTILFHHFPMTTFIWTDALDNAVCF
jgi:hypothetical protein